ncbi:MAG: hypothetical protein IJ772_05165 [Bacilli bacterium]|nr:hypothetical protein [Bacilli bacterium]
MPERLFMDLYYNADITLIHDLKFRKETGELMTRPDLMNLLNVLESFPEGDRVKRLEFAQRIFKDMFLRNGKLI